ncbi:hypothetical protein EASAB2608_00161 [Streptomyces sp. EAS-AB2608]|nr:hypothetical protein EASAB2608_00161 [Streptomyces sp. EAS-AB2608]
MAARVAVSPAASIILVSRAEKDMTPRIRLEMGIRTRSDSGGPVRADGSMKGGADACVGRPTYRVGTGERIDRRSPQ